VKVFENRVLRRIFELKRDEVTGDWRKLYNEKFPNFYPLPRIIRMNESKKMRWTGLVARIGEKRNAYRILKENLEGRRSLGRPRSRWEDNIRTDLREIEWGVMDWIHMAEHRDQWRALVNTAMNFRVP
jgi:hypothetical protein